MNPTDQSSLGQHVSICVLLISVLLSFQVAAQVRVNGIVNGKDGSGIPAANVLLLDAADSSMVKGLVADSDGKFNFNEVRPGKFLIVASMVGFEKGYTDSFNVDDAPVYLSPIRLEERKTELKEVTVSADKPMFEQHIDKLVVNVENSIVSAGGTVLEVLQRSPGITFNKQANALTLVGKQGVVVMINGKIQRIPMDALVQILSGMNANSVDKIEIITNPSSKYDAEGDAGIINIIMKRSPEVGTNGSYTLSMGYGWYEKPSGSIRVDHRNAKASYFADYSVNYNHLWQEFSFRGENQLANQKVNTVSSRYCEILVHRASLGAEFNISRKAVIGTMVSAFDNKWTMDAWNDSRMQTMTSPTSAIILNDVERNQWKNVMGNVNLRKTLTDGSFTFDADYLYFRDENPHQYNNSYYYYENDSSALQGIDIRKVTPIRMAVIKIDFEKNIGNVRFETGAKATASSLSNNVRVLENIGEGWAVDENFTQDYDMTDDVMAAYLNASFNIDEKTKVQTGLRTESTDMEITSKEEKIFDLEFWKLFPTAFVTRQVGKDKNLQFSYGKRITRPSYRDIAPFVVFIDPFTYFSGNPVLKPTITHNFTATYSHKQFIVTAKYSRDDNYIARFQARFDPVEKKTYYFSSNLDKVQTQSLSVTYPFGLIKWWEVRVNAQGMIQRINTAYQGTTVDVEVTTAEGNITNTFELGKGYSAQVAGFYRSPFLFGVQRASSFSEISAGLQKKFANNSGSLRINVGDIFWTSQYRFALNNDAINLHQSGRLKFEPRVVTVSFTKNFGSKGVKSGRRTTASEAEQGRVN